jgi:hypothetical protein
MTDTPETASWGTFAADAPELAAAVEGRLTANKHHVLASLRRDGTPRVSGTEVVLRPPDLLLGSMPDAVKAKDLQRDPRFAIHANPGDGSMAGGDAKLAGLAAEVTDPDEVARLMEGVGALPGPMHLFRLQLAEVVLTSLHPDGDRLVIELWRPGQGVERTERA